MDIEIVVEPGMFHVWPLIDMPEARRARDRIVAFLEADAQARPTSAEAAALTPPPSPAAP